MYKLVNVVRVTQWLERRHIDLIILISLWDRGTGPSDERSRIAAGVARKKEPLLLKAVKAKHRSKAALSPVIMTTAGKQKNFSSDYKQLNKVVIAITNFPYSVATYIFHHHLYMVFISSSGDWSKYDQFLM
jgi:hypothetical protein